ncbi:MAG: hypothetical protein F2667_05015 [Actinobacteria bacterium]|uniref:Unannotated protein n=1 Tax=freshwater metagenome TaxID=449393 RepID=A0A6J6PRS3_9ZZZZ|nr:hypothetical protein [Actinomycetota bacterium]
MKPLQSVAMGLVIIGLVAPLHGYDLLPDPIGWLLVVLGVRGLPTSVERRPLLHAVAVLAALVSVALWVPRVADALADTDDSLVWTASLPQLAFQVLLAHSLAEAAAEAGDVRSARWLGLARTVAVVVALAPVLVFGAGLRDWEPVTFLAADLLLLTLIVLLFRYASRGWAQPPAGMVQMSTKSGDTS